jgi:hypothetical protein
MPVTLLLLLLPLLAVAPSAEAQQATISAGMTLDDVVQRLGQPARSRVSGEWRYLFYSNDCSPRCGSDDVIFVHRGEVVSAVLRDSRRRYAGPGTSQALPPLAAQDAMPGRPAAPVGRPAGAPGAAPPAAVQGIRIEVPAEGAPAGAVQLLPGGEETLTPAQRQRLREQRVEPRTVPGDSAFLERREREQRIEPRTTPADTGLIQRRQREQRVEPRTSGAD